jgi:hypothetical protein
LETESEGRKRAESASPWTSRLADDRCGDGGVTVKFPSDHPRRCRGGPEHPSNIFHKFDHGLDHNPVGVEAEGSSEKPKKRRPANLGLSVAAGFGFEPRLSASVSVVIKLEDPTESRCSHSPCKDEDGLSAAPEEWPVGPGGTHMS